MELRDGPVISLVTRARPTGTFTYKRADATFAFRVDASRQIGIGHFMRCLTLADALARCGARIYFLSRHQPDHLRAMLKERRHECVVLDGSAWEDSSDELTHSHWLGSDQDTDARETIQALSGRRWDWMIVDHYALDTRWEGAVRAAVDRIFVIDDIADRPHDSELLLDQNVYVDMTTRYSARVPASCTLLLGPSYALLRPGFRRWRKRVKPRVGVRRILVCFGGVDSDNHTVRAIEALRAVGTGTKRVDVVIGAAHADRTGVEAACWEAGFACHVQAENMAELMAAADLAIGAAGSTSWERCCVGLPTICVATAANQVPIAEGLQARGAVLMAKPGPAGPEPDISSALVSLFEHPGLLTSLSCAASSLVDGLGVWRVRDYLFKTLAPSGSRH
jgi:UDP-2,4-diacetamido-2,4,6-trideoxy-beta-L-altropyranose hydrolase